MIFTYDIIAKSGSLLFEVGRGWKNRVQSDLETVLDHLRDHVHQYGAVEFQAWIGVDLDQPRSKFGIDHKIETEYFKIVAFSIWIQEN